ncbi:polyketide cyclase [Nocardioides psychrotolerans]|uniref:Polyketide cyclase / dehydrase and lipid transport n=1 Tax=Nocardioides psychrotolerans TaxID=1005945 RepID=A0A1I3DPB1_9ACTN|nr:SRPBCC family protein [Nocardioides psychrotolerans]GEP40545.1 polyketide cyclase [Nocardioides psychrotolerans]SFH88546.1 Polyketide cyclase / dehydrase and lipid transport [Nocardioides psychrotolerans]
MSRNTRIVSATSEQVWEVLSDGWLYPLWVVGASRMRDVDDTWPAVGSRLHHSVGAWPALIDDNTEVLEVRPGSLLRLRARAWPAGEAEVVIHTEAAADGTAITIEEDAVAGPGALVPSFLRQPPLAWRNVETLRRLAFVVERRP